MAEEFHPQARFGRKVRDFMIESEKLKYITLLFIQIKFKIK